MPFLPLLLKKEIYERSLKDFKLRVDDYLQLNSTLMNILHILYKKQINKNTSIPIIRNIEGKIFLGSVKVEGLVNYLKKKTKE